MYSRYISEKEKLDECRKRYRRSIDNLINLHKKQQQLKQSITTGKQLDNLNEEETKLRREFNLVKENMEKQRSVVLELQRIGLEHFCEDFNDKYRGKYIKLTKDINNGKQIIHGKISDKVFDNISRIIFNNIILTDVIQLTIKDKEFSVKKEREISIFSLTFCMDYLERGLIEFENFDSAERLTLKSMLNKYTKEDY